MFWGWKRRTWKVMQKLLRRNDAKLEKLEKQVNWNNKIKKRTIKLPREAYVAHAAL